jgi:hypothetical protein
VQRPEEPKPSAPDKHRYCDSVECRVFGLLTAVSSGQRVLRIERDSTQIEKRCVGRRSRMSGWPALGETYPS